MTFGQITDPVKWDFKAVQLDGKTYSIQIKAIIDTTWHIYSQSSSILASSPTVIIINKHRQIHPYGPIEEMGNLIDKFDEIFEESIKYFEGSVVFAQKVRVKGKLPISVQGSVEYSACNGEQCLPSKSVDFNVLLE